MKLREKTMRNLIARGRLVPIVKTSGDDVLLVGYRRKASSRFAGNSPRGATHMLRHAVPLAKITTETAPVAAEGVAA